MKEVVIIRIESYFYAFHCQSYKMLKLHLILAWFSCKLDVTFPTFHTSVKRRKITFNS